MKAYKAVLIILGIILVDQVLKIYVKTHFAMEESYPLTGWFRLLFVENEGMAFSMKFPGVWGKLLLSTFRLLAAAGGIWYIRKLIKDNAHWGFITAASMILAGAVGNMIDGCFYGVIFSASTPYQVAEFMPAGGGYTGFMQGHVVDMLKFTFYQGILPEWVPFMGGKYWEFFAPIFNVADAAITTGVFIILIFQGVFFKEEKKEEEKEVPVDKQLKDDGSLDMPPAESEA
jgi:signal peptidase II